MSTILVDGVEYVPKEALASYYTRFLPVGHIVRITGKSGLGGRYGVIRSGPGKGAVMVEVPPIAAGEGRILACRRVDPEDLELMP